MPQNNPAALPRDRFVQVLRAAGSRTFTAEQLEADIAAGAPVNEDGTVNIVAYAAWILKGNLNGD